ncbi:hypothetical protein RvY_05937 [Ramazzottius varieornatus]|uniref:Chitin-binding type-2 domain-containing protein n=1 Tax=Ramazzottius varieornatus TaxID=947166 RepID=A0A1D1UWU1_RAMVA|nr:hypothetical protein RvY_05937 [Ramazzottius varieornatus]
MKTAILFLGLLVGAYAQQNATASQPKQGSQVPQVVITPVQGQSGAQQDNGTQPAADQQDSQSQQQQQAESSQQQQSASQSRATIQQPSLTFTEQRSGFQQIRSHGPVDNGHQIRQPGFHAVVGPNQGPGQGQVQQQSGQYVFDLYKNVPALDSEAVIDILATSQPGVSFPLNAVIPNTGFDCANQATPGFFADSAPPSLCQAYYRCDPSGNQTGFLCPNQTVFNQLTLTCDYYYNVDCAASKTLYGYANTRLYRPDAPLFDTPPQGYISRLSGLDQNGASIVIGLNGQSGQSQVPSRNLDVAQATTQAPTSVAAVVGVGAGPGNAIRSPVASSSNANVVGVGSGPGAARAVVNVVPLNVVSVQQTTGPVVPVLGPGSGAAAILAQRPARPVIVQAATTTTTTTTTTPSTTTTEQITTTTEETTTEALSTSAPATEVTADAGSVVGVATLNGQPAVSTLSLVPTVPVVPVANVSATSTSGIVVLPVGVVKGTAGSQVSPAAVVASPVVTEAPAAVQTSTTAGGVTIVVQPATVAPAA